VDVIQDDKTLHQEYPQHNVDIRATQILLPSTCEYLDASEEEDYLSLPSTFCDSSGPKPSTKIDGYLSTVPTILESAETLLNVAPVVLSNGIKSRVLNVCQGEVAHAVSSQCDVIASDDATTCHILAVRSVSMSGVCEPLSSMAHIDKAGYESCIRGIILEHKRHHQAHMNNDDRLDMDLHIVGGFDDKEGSSRKITEFLLRLLVKIADEESHCIRMTLRTCAVSLLNDDGFRCPIARGLGLNLTTGETFLVDVDASIAGPALALRACRLWSASASCKLHLIHSADGRNVSEITVEPFKFHPFKNLDLILRLPDHIMLQYTSTSPEVEKKNFCDNVRRTLRFIKLYKWQSIFGKDCKRSLVFRRVGLANNEWEQVKPF